MLLQAATALQAGDGHNLECRITAAGGPTKDYSGTSRGFWILSAHDKDGLLDTASANFGLISIHCKAARIAPQEFPAKETDCHLNGAPVTVPSCGQHAVVPTRKGVCCLNE